MKFLHYIGILTAAIFIAGCADDQATKVQTTAPAQVGTNVTAKTTVNAAPAPEAKPLAPTHTVAKVVMVKADPKENFLVVEYFSNDIPAVGTMLTLYRAKERVGVVKVTEPRRPPHVTADIVEGQPRVGDEVR